jgi:hypothetical protein
MKMGSNGASEAYVVETPDYVRASRQRRWKLIDLHTN